MNRITFLGELAANTGYGQHSLEIIKGLQTAGYWVSILPFQLSPRITPEIAKLFVHCHQPEPIEILLSPPHRDPSERHEVIYYTMWESSVLPPVSVDRLNKARLVVVPCQWNATEFRNSGVERDIEVVPLGIDPDVFYYRAPVRDGIFRFAAGGNLYNGRKRKGVDDVVKTFLKAFPGNPKVRLMLKVVGDLDAKDDRIEINRLPLSDHDMALWYSQSDCFVSAARSEGWGLMQLQAMASGRPVIAAAFGGLYEFLDEKVGYPLFWKHAEAEETWAGHGYWCQPNLEHMELCMRRAYENREEVEELGEAAAARADEFHWQKGVRKLIDVVHRVESSLPGPASTWSQHSETEGIPNAAGAIQHPICR